MHPKPHLPPFIILIIPLIPIRHTFAESFHVPAHHPTIQSCIDAAVSGQDECVVAPGTYNELINFLGKAITLRSSHGPTVTTIDGNGLSGSVVSCKNAETSDTVIKGFAITGGTGTNLFPNETAGGGMYNANSSPIVINCVFIGNSAGHGGGVYNIDSNPTLTDCTFDANSSTYRGGGIDNQRSSPALTNCTFSNNVSSSGGGMFNYYGSPTLTGCLFVANTGSFGGGGMYNLGSNPVMTGCMFIENTGTEGGGGILNQDDSTPILSDCLFLGNLAPSGAGGGMHNWNSSPTLNECEFRINRSASAGGGIYNSGDPILTDCVFRENFSGFGGALYNDSGSPTFVRCEFTRNSAYHAGGGVYSVQSNPLIHDSTFKLNDAVIGGGMYNGGAPGIQNCYFGGNQAQQGGGIFNGIGAETEILDCTFQGNVALTEGAGVFNHQSKSRIERCVFHLNQALIGGGLRNIYSTVDVVDCDFEDNTAYESGAGMANGESPDSTFQFGNSALRSTFDLYTVTGGSFRANESYKNDPSHGGGAIYDNALATTITDVAFENNIASGCGGAVFSLSPDLTVRQCSFVANGAGHKGGALHGGGEVDHCLFEANTSPNGNGGAIAARSDDEWNIANSTFIGNSAASGGATYGPGEIRQCSFLNNKATYAGGAAHSPTTLSHSYLAANQVTLVGGALYTDRPTRLVNNVFVGNEANSGGAIFNDHSLSVFNCTLLNNLARGFGGAIANQHFDKTVHSLSVSNTIIYENTASENGHQIWSGPEPFDTTISFSNVEDCGGSENWDASIGVDAGGNLDVDPEFVRLPNDGLDGWGDDPVTLGIDEGLNDDFGDLRLQPGSPCINAGDPAYPFIPGDSDLDGHPRVLCGRIDMGAYESGIGDYDCNQIVDLADFSAWPSCSASPYHSLASQSTIENRQSKIGTGCSSFDFDADGDVDLLDFAKLQNLFAAP